MPEGDTVWLAGRRLHDALAGRALTHADLRVPQHATADLTGRTVTEVVSRGKHLLFRLDGDNSDGSNEPLTLHTHFRMDGTWHLYRRGRPVARRAGVAGARGAGERRLAGGRLPAAGGRAAASQP